MGRVCNISVERNASMIIYSDSVKIHINRFKWEKIPTENEIVALLET